MPHFVLIFPNFSRGGAENAFREYIRTLRSIGKVSAIVTSKHSVSIDESLHYISKNRLFSFIYLCYAILKISSNTKEEIFFISFKGHLYISLILSIILKFNSNFHFIMRESSDVIGFLKYEINSPLRKIFYKFMIKKIPAILAEKVIVNSKGSATNFAKLTNTSLTKISTIYNPKFTAQELEHSIDANKPIKQRHYDLGFFGRLEYQKDPMSFVELVGRVARHNPSVKALMMGSGSLSAEVHDRIVELQLTEVIQRLPFELFDASYLQNTKVVVLTSYYEGMPNVLLEGIFNGCRFVAYDCPSGPSELSSVCYVVGAVAEKRGISELELALNKVQSRFTEDANSIEVLSEMTTEYFRVMLKREIFSHEK